MVIVFDKVYILFNFNIIHKHNGMSFTKKNLLIETCVYGVGMNQ
jgi:hypothetical protein